MKGILLAGGTGSRLNPATSVTSKHLLPIYDKPLIFYSLTNLMLAGISEILIICRPSDYDAYFKLLGTGHKLGLTIRYAEQAQPSGIAEALIIGENFFPHESVCLALGDNIFHGSGLSVLFGKNAELIQGASILLRQVPDPHRFGVAEIDDAGKVLSIAEKPEIPKTNLAVTGLYFYDQSAPSRARSLGLSSRNELEITDLNNSYLADGQLTADHLPRGTMWLDAGTAESMLDASLYVRSVQEHSGQLIGSPEEVSWRQGWISSEDALALSRNYKSRYGESLRETIIRGF